MHTQDVYTETPLLNQHQASKELALPAQEATQTKNTHICLSLTLCSEYPDSNIIGGSNRRKNMFGRNISSSCKHKMGIFRGVEFV